MSQVVGLAQARTAWFLDETMKDEIMKDETNEGEAIRTPTILVQRF
jgi:hypothetical protein